MEKEYNETDQEADAQEKSNATKEPTQDELDALNKMTDTSEKPEYKKMVELTIDGVSIRKSVEPIADTTGEEYLSWRVQLKYSDKQTESFGGLRQYPDRLWYGDNSAFGRLKTNLENFLEVDHKLSFSDLHCLLRLLRVLLQSSKHYQCRMMLCKCRPPARQPPFLS